MPPPLEWEPCVAQPVPGLDCQQIKIDWSGGAFQPLDVWQQFSLDAGGLPLFMLVRTVTDEKGSYVDRLIADADGAVRFVMRRPGEWDDGCTPYADDLNEARFAFHVRGDGSTEYSLDSKADGLIYGEIGERVPRVGPLRDDTDLAWSWKIGREWFIKQIGPAHIDELYEPDFELKQQLWNPSTDPDWLPIATPPIIVGRDILFAVGNYSMLGIMAYDDVRGVHPLVRWYSDFTQGAGNVGTDGKHIVWTYGEQKPLGEPLYPVRSIMAADYTTDPSELAPKRLRSDPSADIGNPFVVGCGYAAHQGPTPQDTIIVRIADGVSWTLTGVQLEWSWGVPIGLTCEDLFTLVFTPPKYQPNIARVRLDSLGPGTAPD